MKPRIGKYRIDALLGEGAFGEVYLAFDPLIERRVALKVLKVRGGFDEEGRARFLREARSAGRLQHQNIVAIYELGEDDDGLFIAMEYVEGCDLREYTSGQQFLPFTDLLSALSQVCRALDFAHSNSILHRDINPASLRITRGGIAKILDFGLARLKRSELARHRQRLGTPHHMSPEQADGVRELDRRTDLLGRQRVERRRRVEELYGIARRALGAGNLENAEGHLRRAIALESSHTMALHIWRELDLARGQRQGQKAREERIARLTAQSEAALHAGHLEEAQALCEELLALAPALSRAMALRSEIQGVRAARQLAREREARIAAILEQADQLERRGELGASWQRVTDALALAPDHPGAVAQRRDLTDRGVVKLERLLASGRPGQAVALDPGATVFKLVSTTCSTASPLPPNQTCSVRLGLLATPG